MSHFEEPELEDGKSDLLLLRTAEGDQQGYRRIDPMRPSRREWITEDGKRIISDDMVDSWERIFPKPQNPEKSDPSARGG